MHSDLATRIHLVGKYLITSDHMSHQTSSAQVDQDQL